MIAETRHSVAVQISALALVFLTSACSSTAANSKQDTVDVLDPTQPQFGNSYAGWGSALWQWFYQMQMPASGECIDPLTDPTGASCAFGQDPSSPVFFLTGNTGGTVVRTACVVPAGKAVFFPIFDVAADNGGVPPAAVLTPTQLHDTIQSEIDSLLLTNLTAIVDGKELADIARFKVNATEFSYTVPPEPNTYSCGGVSFSGPVDPSYQGGYYVMLPAFAPGAHEIHFTAREVVQPEDFVVDVTFDFSVE